MSKSTQIEARIEILHAAMLALCAALPPEQATFTERLFSAALADLDDQSHPQAIDNADHDAEAVSAGMVATILKTLDHQLPG